LYFYCITDDTDKLIPIEEPVLRAVQDTFTDNKMGETQEPHCA